MRDYCCLRLELSHYPALSVMNNNIFCANETYAFHSRISELNDDRRDVRKFVLFQAALLVFCNCDQSMREDNMLHATRQDMDIWPRIL